MKSILAIFIVIAIFYSIPVYAKVKIVQWNDIRLRYEFQNNFNKKSYGNKPIVGSKDDGFLLGRIRTGAIFNFSKNIELSLGLQHSVSWDTALKNDDFYKKNFGLKNNPYKAYLEPFKTYLKLKNIFSLPLSLKIGRQLIFYGDHRIFGPGSWGNSGRWNWDAVKLSYKFKRGFVDIYWGRSVLHKFNQFSYNHRHGYESEGFYSSYTLSNASPLIKIQLFAMTKKDFHKRYKSERGIFDDLNSYYYGFRTVLKNFYNFTSDFTYIKQEGDYSKDDIDAYGYHLLIGYDFGYFNFKPCLSFEFTYASGDNNHKDGKHKTFDGAFGALDQVLGRINLFKWQNVKDYQLNLTFNLFKKLYFKTQYHDFYLSKRKDAWYLNSKYYIDKTGKSGDRVGKEFDIECKYKLNKISTLHTGFGHFWPGQFAKNVTHSESQANWFFIQFEIKFKSGG